MDQARPYILASNELCYDVNPTLWNLYCALTGRPVGQPNYIWTEQDVVTAILARGLNNVARTYDSDNGNTGIEQSGSGYNIRHDNSSGIAMAVRHMPNSEDSVVYIIGS